MSPNLDLKSSTLWMSAGSSPSVEVQVATVSRTIETQTCCSDIAAKTQWKQALQPPAVFLSQYMSKYISFPELVPWLWENVGNRFRARSVCFCCCCLFSLGVTPLPADWIAPAGAHSPGWPCRTIRGHCWERAIFCRLWCFISGSFSLYLLPQQLVIFSWSQWRFFMWVCVCVSEWIAPLLRFRSIMPLGGIFLYSIFSFHTLNCVPLRGNCFW